MAPSVEMPTQPRPTVPAPPSSDQEGLRPRDPVPVIGGPGGGPPRPPKRPTGGGGNGGGGESGGPGDDGARKRFAYIVGLVGVVVLVVMFALLSTSGSDEATTPEGLPVATQSQAKAAAASMQTTPAPGQTPTATAAPTPVSTANLPLLKAGSITKINVKQGDDVTFRVTSATAQEVHVHGYDNKYELAAGETKTVTFPATITGIFEIEFESTSTQIGELTVEP